MTPWSSAQLELQYMTEVVHTQSMWAEQHRNTKTVCLVHRLATRRHGDMTNRRLLPNCHIPIFRAAEPESGPVSRLGDHANILAHQDLTDFLCCARCRERLGIGTIIDWSRSRSFLVPMIGPGPILILVPVPVPVPILVL